MEEPGKHSLYYSLTRVSLAMLVIISFICASYLFTTDVLNTNNSRTYLYMGYIGMILFGLLFIIGLFTLYRAITKVPYITITNEQIIIQPQTRKEVIIDRADYVNFALATAAQMNKILLFVRHADKYTVMLEKSFRFRFFHNEDTNVSSIPVDLNPLSNTDRAVFFNALQLLLQFRDVENEAVVHLIKEQIDDVKVPSLYRRLFLPDMPVEKIINKKYFMQAYGLSLFFFVINFTVFYYFTSESSRYLLLIILNLFVYPFAQAFTDWIYGFKVKQLDEYGGYFARMLDQFRFLANAFVIFHLSIFFAPISGIFFGLRYLLNKSKK